MDNELKLFVWDNTAPYCIDIIIQVARSKEEAIKLVVERDTAELGAYSFYDAEDFTTFLFAPMSNLKVLPLEGYGIHIAS